ncbi:tryptophan halogenase family protein [Parerythrobacter aestuarii]|uniref:tryptophan halogenase family protein n=1 Tax=Parerythrobacter aestuarii TaxID=3020909 RepID=UPI0024DE2D08|nr:tryptophan halogenase family protein [Parerythrobacter aestuarii]
MSEGPAPKVVILGGGSAGWITACLLHQRWAGKGGSVTVVESTDIGIIGVGEGSTPQLKAFFDMLGIEEAEWMSACNATYKLGIRFSGWSELSGFESYFHPFPGPVDLHTEPAFIHSCALARRGFEVPAHPDDWFLAAALAAAGKSPHPEANFPFAPSYGYHFDAHSLGGFLREWATARGLVHMDRKVEEVELNDGGDVSALICSNGERVEGDFFIDCSGFRSMIAQEALGVEFLPFDENLFCDRAVVVPTPHEERFKPQTEAIAMAAGWRWSIPLTTRVGNGYVYASRYISDEDAEAELRAALGDPEGDARLLKMKVGRVYDSWHRNCLAVGLSQGFIEPLEATALHIVIATAVEFANAFEAGGYGSQNRDAFNASIAARYESIRDYIVAHYRLNRRNDTAFWRDNAANEKLSDPLKGIMTAWFRQRNMAEAISELRIGQAYPNLSWHCLFAGYGTFPEKKQPLPDAATDPEESLREVSRILEASIRNFPSNAMN